ncbi:MAG: hypothetical protein U1C46_09465 [Bacteroidales bacterium]|nr:hypothetical protein [Bacteroidales bacterium]
MRRNQFLKSVLTLIFSALSFCFLTAQQEQKINLQASAGLDLTTRYVWRGLVLSPGISAQPYMQLNYSNFSVGAWGSQTLHPFEWMETDFFVSYEWRSLKISVWDYFYFDFSSATPHYFNYQKGKTGHVIETVVEFKGTEKIPVRLLAGYNFYGNDPAKSVYIETAWMKSLGETNLEIFAGYTPTIGYYHKTKKGLTNVGISMARDLLVGNNLSLPLRVSVVYNPMVQQTFLVATIGIR